jgi:hypothetical protein
MRFPTARHSFTAALAALWVAGLGVGGWSLTKYGNEAGVAGTAPADWPGQSGLTRRPGLPTLVMLVHPQCPCTRATVDELAGLMAHAQGKLVAHVLFAKPDGAPPDWNRGGLWNAVSAIPGVHVQCDEGGMEARRFGAETSGQTMLFDPAGRLIFRGGITAARGHAGPNAGSAAVAALLHELKAPIEETRVYGCALF